MIEATIQGTVYTFYSFKGGVGRTMALANVAALLAKWGHSVLVVDWDLEAPGIERFFIKEKVEAKERRTSKPGIVDLVLAKGNGQTIDWRTCVHEITLNGSPSPVSLITAGQGNGEYIGNLQKLNFPELFEKSDLGVYIESLRDDWISKFDFVLVDSRTGVTDIGGICTVLLADVLVLLFTTTDSSTDGVLDIMNRARQARQRLPRDRERLVAIPVPARDESRTEYESAKHWRETVGERFGDLYTDWLPSGVTPHDALELLKIPYVPYWSFGERLPVIEEGTGDPASLGYAYEVLAKLVASKLDWKVVEVQSFVPQRKRERRELDAIWLNAERINSQMEFRILSGEPAMIEIFHFCVDYSIQRNVRELLQAAEHSMTNRGHPTGEVKRDEFRPRPLGDRIATPRAILPYWMLNSSGDFYSLIPFYYPDTPMNNTIGLVFADCKILDAAEALIHCAKLYRTLSFPSDATIKLNMSYWRIGGKQLGVYDDHELHHPGSNTALVDKAQGSIEFVLNRFEQEASKLVRDLCAPIFHQFDFAEFPDKDYDRIVSGIMRKIH